MILKRRHGYDPLGRSFKETGLKVLSIFYASTVLISASSPARTQISHGESRVLRARLCDCAGLESAVRLRLREEAGRIYKTAGIDIRWESDCASSPVNLSASHAARIYVVNKLPNSLVYRFKHILKKTNLMAYNLTDPGGMPGAVIYVSLEAVRSNASRSGSIELTPEALSRALGRVVAHELAHRFIQKKHTKRGILKGRFDHHDLIDEDSALQPFFSEKQVKVLLARAKAEPARDFGFSATKGSR